MSRIPMLDNIHGQPASHRALLALQQGKQLATLRACAEKIRKAQGQGDLHRHGRIIVCRSGRGKPP